MTHIVTGLFKSSQAAMDGMRALQSQGVPRSSISVVVSDDFDKDGIKHPVHSKATEGFVVGTAAGGTLGAVLAGIGAVTSIATGGASLGLVAAGPLAAAILGGGAGAAAGSAVGTMFGAAIPDKDFEYYETSFKAGAVLVGVSTDDAKVAAIAQATLEDADAEKVTHAPSKLVKRLIENDAEAKVPT